MRNNESLSIYDRQVFLKMISFIKTRKKDEIVSQPENDSRQEEKKPPVRHNWVTDIYDKMDISVRTLDIALVVLCAIVVFCFIYGAKR